MIELNHITAIILKDFKDVLKNVQILILFIVYPAVCFIMSQSVGTEMTFFVSVFATMHFVFTPIIVSSSMIAEEKAKNTLRILRMSGISSLEFFLSTAGFVLIFDCITGSFFMLMSGGNTISAGMFYSAGIVGSVISIMIGMCIGTFSKSPSATSGLAVPLGMIFSFLPMLSHFNKGLGNISKYLFGQQVAYLIGGKKWSAETIVVCLVNLIIVTGFYVFLYKRTKLDE